MKEFMTFFPIVAAFILILYIIQKSPVSIPAYEFQIHWITLLLGLVLVIFLVLYLLLRK